MNIELLTKSEAIVLQCLSGSKAYGLDTPNSDTDIKGVFVLPKEKFFGLSYIPQVSDATNDTTYYELGRYVELLLANNPSILELAATPARHTTIKHHLLDQLDVGDFISKRCAKTFGGYALSQLKRARGLNKKIVNPMDGPRKELLDFCYVAGRKGSQPLKRLLADKGWKQQECGVVAIPKMKDLYGLFHSKNSEYKGVVSDENATSLSLSSVRKEATQKALLYFNKEAYSTYCRRYKEYHEWVKSRNEDRYKTTVKHGKKYDAKNLMHTFRLLEMGIEIAHTGEVNVTRPNREFLLSIKRGDFEYDELLTMAEAKMATLEEAFAASKLQAEPSAKTADRLLNTLRSEFYR